MVILLCLDLGDLSLPKGQFGHLGKYFFFLYKKKYIAKPYKIRHHTIHIKGPVVQLVRAPPCHGGGCGFESRQARKN
jgi:hypothetical protein